MAAKTVLEEFVIYLGAEVNQQELDGMINSIAKVSRTLQKAAKVAVGFATGIATASTLINKHTTEQSRLAESVGSTVDTLAALTQAGSDIGMTFENSADLVEEMMNKFGEMKFTGEFKAVEESMAALNLQWEDMKKLSPEEQFIKIMDTASKAKDAQVAAFAVDSLLGGEANKILGSLRRRSTTLTEIIKQTKKLNYETERSRKGAARHVDAMSKLETVVASISKLFSGIFGEALADITEEMNEWFEINKEIIQQNLIEFAERLSDAFRALWRVGRAFIEVAISITKALGGLANIFKLLKFAAVAAGIAVVVMAFLKWQTVLYAIIAVFKVLTATMLANPFVLLTAAILAALVAAEDFYKWINGNTDGTMFGKWLGSADEFFKKITDGFNSITDTMAKFVTDTITGATKWGVEFAAAIKEGLVLALANIIQFGIDGLAKIMTWADSVYSYVTDKFTGMTPDLTDMIPDFTGMIPDFTGMLPDFTGMLHEFFKSITDGFNEITGAMADFVTDTIAGAKKWGVEFSAAIKEGLNLALANIIQFGIDSLTKIKAWADSVYTYVSNKLGSMIPDFKGMLPDAVIKFFGESEEGGDSESVTQTKTETITENRIKEQQKEVITRITKEDPSRAKVPEWISVFSTKPAPQSTNTNSSVQNYTDGNQYSTTESNAVNNVDNSRTEYHITATGIADAPTLAASIQDMNTKKANNVAAMQ